MAQWFAAKAEHPDALLFFRMGDFYELFFADAEAAAAALDIALSHRGEHNGVPIPMCGVPHHAAEIYLARLIRRGFRVAIVEQMEDPKTRAGKAPIKREVVRIITPGTITEESLLEAGRPNLLLALAWDQDDLGAAWVDVSTGLFETAALPQPTCPRCWAGSNRRRSWRRKTLDLASGAARRSPEPVPSPPLIARGGVGRGLSAPSASMRSAASPTARPWRRRWRWITSAPPSRGRCRGWAGRSRRVRPACWRWMRRRAPVWRSSAPATAARSIRLSRRCSTR